LLADTPALNLKEFTDKTEYSIMFGPDRCGNDNKVHTLFYFITLITLISFYIQQISSSMPLHHNFHNCQTAIIIIKLQEIIL